MENRFEFILYVSDQERSRDFYMHLLQQSPSLDVPGMTEFRLAENIILGLMPDKGIAKIISPPLPHPDSGSGIPRCEIYLQVKNVDLWFERGIHSGGISVSRPENRLWNAYVGYIADPDGHVIAFARNL